jgi:hypothetical protein
LLIQANEFEGWVSYSNLALPPFRLCILALLTSIESSALEILQYFVDESMRLCPDKAREAALRQAVKNLGTG